MSRQAFDLAGYRRDAAWTVARDLRADGAVPSESHGGRTSSTRWGQVRTQDAADAVGVHYDSEEARGQARCRRSDGRLVCRIGEMAKRLGAFPGYAKNREHSCVIRNHRRAVPADESEYGADNPPGDRPVLPRRTRAARGVGPRARLARARLPQRASERGRADERRPLMDCDTTGISPTRAGRFRARRGSYFRIIAARSRGSSAWAPPSRSTTSSHALSSQHAQGARDQRGDLRAKGFTAEAIDKIGCNEPPRPLLRHQSLHAGRRVPARRPARRPRLRGPGLTS